MHGQRPRSKRASKQPVSVFRHVSPAVAAVLGRRLFVTEEIMEPKEEDIVKGQECEDAGSSDARIGPEAARAGGKSKSRRKVLFLRPPRHRNGEPEPDFDGPVVVTSPPDLAIQIQRGSCSSEDELRSERDSIRDLVSPFFAGVDARAICVDGRESIGVWLDAHGGREENTARDRALRQLSLLRGNETFGTFVNARAVRRLGQAEFDRMPKRLDADGTPRADGSVHLERLSVGLLPPNQVITRIEGFDDRPWPDVDFTATVTDMIEVGQRSVTCGDEPESIEGLVCTSTTDVDLDDADVAWAIILGLGTAPFGVGLYFIGRLIAAAVEGAGGAGGSGEGGVGCGLVAIAQAPIPRRGRDLELNRGSKLVIEYSRREVTTGGLFFGGRWLLCFRHPSVGIAGPRSLSATLPRTSLTASFSAQISETFGPVHVRWEAENAFVHHPTATTTTITFDLEGRRRNSSVVESRITLHSHDADGPLPTGSIPVRIELHEAPRSRGGARRQPL